MSKIDTDKLRKRDNLLGTIRRAFQLYTEKKPLKTIEEGFIAGLLTGAKMERNSPGKLELDVK